VSRLKVLFLEGEFVLGNQSLDDLIELRAVLDINQGNTTALCHQAARGEIDDILIMNDPAEKKIPFNCNYLSKPDLPKNNHWHTQDREAKNSGIDDIRKDRAGDCHEDKENAGNHTDGIENNRQADAGGVLRFENKFFPGGAI
jgi:hypothetical protein